MVSYMSKVLPPGGWRVTLNWDKDPADMDSHTWFGKNMAIHDYWPSRARVKTAAGYPITIGKWTKHV